MEPNELKITGAQANNVMAAQMVDLYGAGAIDRCCGAMLVAVRRELRRRRDDALLNDPDYYQPEIAKRPLPRAT